MGDTDGTATGGKGLVRRFLEIMDTREYKALGEVLHPEFVIEWPQSGERVRGVKNALAVFANYPGGLGEGFAPDRTEVLGAEPRYVMTPTFNVIRLEGTGDTITAYTKTRYPDGTDWYVVSLVTVRDGAIVKQVSFFAPVYPAPAWRAAWVEPLGAPD